MGVNSLPKTIARQRQPRSNLSNSDSPSPLNGLPPSAPSIHHSHYPSPHHSLIPGLKPSFSANICLSFFSSSGLTLYGFPGPFADTAEHIRFFSFYVFHFLVFGAVW